MDGSGTHVITLEREYASGGSEIAALLAERLRWDLWNHNLTRAIAKQIECAIGKVAEHEERRDPAFYRLLKGFLCGSFEGSLKLPQFDFLDAERVTAITAQLVHEAATHRNVVIVGRGSAYFLQDYPGVLHVFIYAPLEQKIERLIADGMTPGEARRRVRTVDRDRAAFIRAYFHKEWPKRSLYHLMVNSAIGVEAAVQLIIEAMKLVSTKPETAAAR